MVGPQAYHRLPDLIDKAIRGEQALDTDMPAASKFGALPGRGKQTRPTAFLTVQEGCDKFCTYCVVPYTRGAEISRPWSAVIDEAKALIDGGVRDALQFGVNANHFAGAVAQQGVGLALLVVQVHNKQVATARLMMVWLTLSLKTLATRSKYFYTVSSVFSA
mgnify:CR=1 FL=1